MDNIESFNFLPEIYDILKCLESNPTKLNAKINELKLKFEKSRALLATMPGIDVSSNEQKDYYQSLLKQYQLENDLLAKYKDMCTLDTTKLSQGPSHDFLHPPPPPPVSPPRINEPVNEEAAVAKGNSGNGNDTSIKIEPQETATTTSPPQQMMDIS